MFQTSPVSCGVIRKSLAAGAEGAGLCPTRRIDPKKIFHVTQIQTEHPRHHRGVSLRWSWGHGALTGLPSVPQLADPRPPF